MNKIDKNDYNYLIKKLDRLHNESNFFEIIDIVLESNNKTY